MASSDYDVLLDMGFEPERAKMAVKETGGLQGALEWLEKYQDKSLDEIKQPATSPDDADADADGPALQPGEEAKSLVCNDCGKRFRSQAQAEFHASKTEHVDFFESTEEIAPLTEEEKKAKVAAIRQRLAEKRSGQTDEERASQKKNEAIRRKSTKETQDLKEELQRKERVKEAVAKRREKQAEVAARDRIRAKIKADQEERKEKAEREKAARDGPAPPPAVVVAAPVAAPAPATSKPASAYTETRLRLQTASQTWQKSFAVDTTLFEVAAAVEEECGLPVDSFTTTFPKKTFSQGIDFGLTLKEAGLVPSAVLIVR
ncbi:MAG: hypothetical protein M1826_002374 [Phylliscum demangeonii]|nr:MAG: hypothetical protein M1826_002374 [Phylliscum demangeonii]